MQVKLLYFTGKDTHDEHYYAARLLAFAKSTRLTLSPEGWVNFQKMPINELENELSYISSTIASAWEHIDLIFLIGGISRACAQQVTRTRHASFSMQAQRVVKVNEAAYIPKSVPANALTHYQLALSAAFANYNQLVEKGVKLEDARGVLPMHALCNLIAKYNFRSWIDLIRTRGSLRVQDEYSEIILRMRTEVLTVWPWANLFLEPKQQKAISMIEQIATELPQETKIRLAKAADLLKKDTA